MTAPLPTPDEVAQMRERHYLVHPLGGGADWCAHDAVPWPCDAARLLALVDSQRQRMQHLENVFVQQDDRLAAVLAECDRADADPLRPRQVHVDRIRRAATGEGT